MNILKENIMKKILLGVLFVATTHLMFAQQFISFEQSEGYSLGNINGQNNWFTTTYSGGNIQNQKVTNEMAVDGTNSLKLVPETSFPPQPDPIVGCFLPFAAPLAALDFTVSFDLNITKQSGTSPYSSSYTFRAVNKVGTQTALVYYIYFARDGEIAVATNPSNPALEVISKTWTANTQYRIKIKGVDENILYYINDELVFTATQLSLNPTDLNRIDFVHDNNIGYAYIDRIALNNEEAVTSINESLQSTDGIGVYPNPVSDVLHVKSESKVNAVSIYDVSGRRIHAELVNETIDVRNLQKGVYVISIETANGRKSHSFIKK